MKHAVALTALCLIGLSCRATTEDATTDRRIHLPGPNVTRYPTRPGWIEQSRYVLRGTRHGHGGCAYHSEGSSYAEWVVESDPVECVQVRARGISPWIAQPMGPPNGIYSQSGDSMRLITRSLSMPPSTRDQAPRRD